MKKIAFYCFAVLILMTNCKKEGPFDQLNQQESPNVRLLTLSDGSRTSVTMLEFSDTCAFDFILDSLGDRMQYLEDAFVSQYYNLNDSLLNVYEDSIGFNYQQALIDFEQDLDFTNSMRQAYVQEEADWLNHDSLDFSNDPSLTYVFNIVEMTLLNEGGEVKIGISLIKMTKDGFVEFTDGDVDKLNRFNEGDMSVLYDTNVVTNLLENRASNCTSWKEKNVYHPYYPNKRVKKHVQFHSWPWKGRGQAEITSYKKAGNSWKKYRMNLGVACQSYFYDNDCDKVKKQGFSGWKRKKAKSIHESFSSWGAFPCYRALNGYSIIGYYEYAGNSNYEVLTW